VSTPALSVAPQSRWLPLAFLSLAGAGLAIGSLVASGHWLFALAPVVIGLLICWPVQIAVGFFAFLVPFEEVTILSGGATGMTLNWLVGATAAVTVILTGLAWIIH